jgi:hypothetical protein
MTLRDRLRSIVSAMPDGASVTLPVAELRAWLVEDPRDRDNTDLVVDFTVEDIAGRFKRTPACVRGWCRVGKLPGAYRMNGSKEWRVPRAGVESFLEGQRTGVVSSPPRPDGTVDLGAWRKTP